MDVKIDLIIYFSGNNSIKNLLNLLMTDYFTIFSLINLWDDSIQILSPADKSSIFIPSRIQSGLVSQPLGIVIFFTLIFLYFTIAYQVAIQRLF